MADQLAFFVGNILDRVNNFRYVPDQMPLSDARATFGLSFLYLLVVFVLHRFMKNRTAYKFEWITIIHNFVLCAGSLLMFVGMVGSLISMFIRHNYSFEPLFCDSHMQEASKGPLYFWIYIFYLSKYYEWLDTVLLILKKNKLTFLHVYHHWVTMLLVWNCLQNEIPVQWTAEVLNAFVHVFMYYYYFLLSCSKRQVWWKKYITQLQIAQFILTNFLHGISFVWHYKYNGNCASFDGWGNQLGLCIINSYLLLFIHFYLSTYKAKKSTAKKEQ